MWPYKDDVVTEACVTLGLCDWNWAFDEEYELFTCPAATSIFVYEKASSVDQHVCACADAAGVKESGLHVWLYLHQDESGKSYRWMPTR